MATWREFSEQAPELAARAEAFLEAHTHKTLATLRKDGSPRISGTECEIVDGELRFGSMWHAMKALDLLRDPRFALHSGSDDPPGWAGDAKVAGTVSETVMESEKSGESYHRFNCNITEVVVVGLNAERTKMTIDSWHEGRGLSHAER